MSRCMLLLYAADGDEAERDRRWAEMPEWDEVTQSMREAAVLVSNAALRSVDSATTVRVRHGEMELTDGPFAVTKEILAEPLGEGLAQRLAAPVRLARRQHGRVLRVMRRVRLSVAGGKCRVDLRQHGVYGVLVLSSHGFLL
jgi:hypothetical protein